MGQLADGRSTAVRAMHFCVPQSKGRPLPLVGPYNKQAAIFSHGHHSYKARSPGPRSWSRVHTPETGHRRMGNMNAFRATGPTVPGFVPYRKLGARSASVPPAHPAMRRTLSNEEVALSCRRSWTGDELEQLVR